MFALFVFCFLATFGVVVSSVSFVTLFVALVLKCCLLFVIVAAAVVVVVFLLLQQQHCSCCCCCLLNIHLLFTLLLPLLKAEFNAWPWHQSGRKGFK